MTYLPPLNGGRLNATISGNTAGAGALLSTGTVTLAGGNNITLSQNGNALTISAANAPAASINISAGTTSASLASATFSNSNGVSFGLNAGVITASHNALTSQSNQVLSASNGSFTYQTAGFSNANGVTFGTSAGSIMTASVNTSYAASNHSHGNPTLNLTNLSGTTASASNGLTLSISAAAQSVQTQSNIQGVIASGSTNRTGDISFANSNGVTFGLSNNTITASVATGGNGVALYDGANSISSGTARVSATGALTASINGQTLNLSAPVVSSLSATGVVSLSNNGGTISIGAPAFSAGVSNLSNDSGNTGTVSNRIIFAGGSNITLSQSTNASGATVSINGGAGGGLALYDGANSISSGTARFSNSNGISFGINGQTLTASHNGITSQSNQRLTLYALGNTTQNSSTSLDARSLSFNGLGAASVGYSNGSIQLSVPQGSSLSATGAVSISSNGGTISIGAPAFSIGMSNIGNTSGTTGTVSNQYILAGGNNITLSQATGAGGNTLSIIGGTGGGGGGGVALSAGGALYSSGTLNVSNAGGALTLSTSPSSVLNMSVPATSSLAAAGAISISTTGSTISVSAPPYGTIDNWEPAQLQHVSLSSSIKGNANVFFFKLQPQAYISATRLNQLVSISVSSSSNSSHAGALSFMAGIFTANGSTLSLITQSSGSQTFQWTNTSNASMSLLTGLQAITMPFNVSMAPDNYWLGMWSRSSTTNTNWFSASNVVVSNNTNVSFNGQFLQSTNATQGVQEGVGYLSATSSALPSSAAFSQITQSVFRSNLMPYIIFKNNTW